MIADSKFNEISRNTVGQICIKGKNVMKKYYKNPEETKKSFYKDSLKIPLKLVINW